ncbi:autotransporter-associated beta strand repeat-containing protein [Prosthecobacter sp.]|uniref:beta strand repeat-containing protein n=1 Tax=Prosthecobacter sp. TaxID=1965333 RepID=UPI002487D04B|nr:autotransporter-associated beta strand repeat-containing protein [Prosthecobacter sp.]MDI1311020.1 autotransporter-associated beta strand repeat-containing protein [Prosthecobacter sp.]
MLCLNIRVQAANDLYWDTNGTTDGSGAATGTWGSSLFWNTDPAGVNNTFQSATDGTNDLHFSAGTNGTTGTITVSGAQSANGLYFEEGAVTISGGTSITLSDGAIINNTAPTSGIPTISTALITTGTVTLTGTRIWLNNSSFAGGGTLNINTTGAPALLENSGALNGLATINLYTAGLDIRQNTGGNSNYNYAVGTTLNFVNSSALTTNFADKTVNWLGNITIASAKTATLGALNATSTLTFSGNISGDGAVTITGLGVTVFSGTNTYAGTTTVNASKLQITGGSAIADTGLVAMSTGSSTNTLDVQSSETIGALSGGTAAFSVVNLAAGQVLTLSSGTQTYSGTFSGSGKLIVAGAQQILATAFTLADVSVSSGTLTLAAVSTITNGLTLTGGTLQGSVARGSTLTLTNAIIVSAGTHSFLSAQSNGGTSGTATINFGGSLTINAGGILKLGTPGANAAYGTANGALSFGAAATSGTKFQLNGNSFTLTGLSTDAATPGTATVENGSTTAATLTVALAASTANTYAGTLRNGGTGTLALTLNGAADSVLTLSGVNTFTGSTTLTSGSLVLASSLALQGSTVTTGGTGIVFDSSVASHSFTFGGLSGSTDLALTDNASNAVTLTIGNNGSSQTYSGVLSGAGALTKVGAGTQTFITAQTYTGATTVNGGTLKLYFDTGTPTSNIIAPGSELILGGGTFLQQQNTVGPNTQTLNGVTVRAGSSVVNQLRVGGGSMLLTLGTVIRETGGTVAFSANGGGASGIAATGTNTTSGIIGGYATYLTTNGGASHSNTTDWATYSGGKIVSLSAGSYSNTAATTASTNLDLTSSVILNSNVTVGSIRFNSAITTPTLTLNGSHIIGSGGILVTPALAGNATLITGGTLTSGNGQDIVIIQNNTTTGGALTVAATLTGAVGLTKSGGGQLILTGTNDYTGATYLNGGVTSISSNANLGAVTTGAAVNLNGGTLSATASVTLDNGGIAQRNITVGSNGGTLDVATGQTLTVSGSVSGDGALSKTGAGTLVLSGTSTGTGVTTVTAGNLQVGAASSGQTGTGQVVLNGADSVLSGTGQVQGTTTVTQGTVRPGDNGGTDVGTLTTADLIFTPVAATTVIELQITGSSPGSTLASDKILIGGALTLNGSSNIVVKGDTYIPTLGDTFVLLDWNTVLDTGTTSIFSTGTDNRTGANIGNEGNLDLPDLSTYGFTWQILDFSGSGSLTLVVVPEPARVLLLLLGILPLYLRRRRA